MFVSVHCELNCEPQLQEGKEGGMECCVVMGRIQVDDMQYIASLQQYTASLQPYIASLQQYMVSLQPYMASLKL